MLVAQVAAEGFDEPRLGRGLRGSGSRTGAVPETGRQILVPAGDLAGGAQQDEARFRPVRLAVRFAGASPQPQDRVRREAQPHDAGDQGGHVGQGNRFGAAFGQIAAERVVELRVGPRPLRRPPAARPRQTWARAPPAVADGVLYRARQIPGAVPCTPRRAPGRWSVRGAARPEEQAHQHVLTAQPMAMSWIRSSTMCQSGSWPMLNRMTRVMVKDAWPAAKEMAAGAIPARSTARGSRNQSAVPWWPISCSSPVPMIEPRGAAQGADRVLPGVEGVRAQHGQGSQEHPERVLDAGHVGEADRYAEAERAAQVVVQPDGTG